MLIKANNIHKHYPQADKSLHVLKGVDLEIKQGEIVAVVGPSGAGKSTLLHILGGLDKPSEGNVIIEGEDIYKINDKKRAEFRNIKIGFIFQFYHLLPEFTALENVLLPCLIKNKDGRSKRYRGKGKKLLEQVGLGERLNHKPTQLSGGEQQRVAIARALINNPKIILCDEPTGNLDTENSNEVIDILHDLNSKNKQTLMIITHDQSIANKAHRIVHMRDGKLN